MLVSTAFYCDLALNYTNTWKAYFNNIIKQRENLSHCMTFSQNYVTVFYRNAYKNCVKFRMKNTCRT